MVSYLIYAAILYHLKVLILVLIEYGLCLVRFSVFLLSFYYLILVMIDYGFCLHSLIICVYTL